MKTNAELRECEQSAAFLSSALAEIAYHDARRAVLSKEAAARAAQLAENLHEVVALLPREPGRPLDETPEEYVQEILRLKRERGWGRPRIVEETGFPERMVRRVLRECLDENLPPARARRDSRVQHRTPGAPRDLIPARPGGKGPTQWPPRSS